ncbi:hypothetical protein [Geomonas anaerohicana]|uniref:Uncharacterized protein n=1 Tax=Geomonas anaerohicana TaxID=2798583 RepID=A0ABS0YK67_9BACT|nr:hypothetical protein [Geomonas anaerohicana]MBJ6752715.1 hypothetical protein [Geomonas anaerohicana]
MAGSRQSHLRRDPFQRPTLTPGPLGHNDAAAPHRQNLLLADTPGPLGRNDAADPSRHAFEKVASPLSQNIERVSLGRVQTIAIEITTYFEGGGYSALAGNSDGQGISFGLLQWNFGQMTLGPLLKKMLLKDPLSFEGCFGKNMEYENLKTAISSNDKTAQLLWAKRVSAKNQNEFRSCFRKLAEVEVFKDIQNKEAIEQIHPLVMQVIKILRAMFPSAFHRIQVRTYVALYDLCVQQHSISKVKTEILRQVRLKKATTQLEIMKIVVTERGRIARARYAADCISRRMAILTGSTFRSDANGLSVERKNPKLSLLSVSGGMYVDI